MKGGGPLKRGVAAIAREKSTLEFENGYVRHIAKHMCHIAKHMCHIAEHVSCHMVKHMSHSGTHVETYIDTHTHTHTPANPIYTH